MTTRDRRAARELRGYLERLYGPQTNLVVVPGAAEGFGRVVLLAENVAVTRPDPTDGQTYSATSFDHYAPGFVAVVGRLAAHLVAIRSARYAPGGGLVPACPQDGAEDLRHAYGALFPEGTVELDVPWQELARAVAEELSAAGLLDGLESAQVKSKFASLRWYFSSIPKKSKAEVNYLLRAATDLSMVVCERCGAPGEHRPRPWHVIACDACDSLWERSRRGGGG
ncbi:hypothetical protein MMB17_05730 [Methylobacterium organophilum]|uniref:hypothetical protein n=1 Tax=Methylobacterium organophilum TaxID=410 RepID=UPI001F141987|nr:hypothetical protein [Methylobacterium organophilum]UMY18815.1 hypothetical protein MMB17_05730 [Methylobacterium organophilum]